LGVGEQDSKSFQYERCMNDERVARYKCQQLYPVSDAGGLDPAVPIAGCYTSSVWQSVRERNPRDRWGIGYLVLDQREGGTGEVLLLSDPGSLQRFYAPITSAPEALAWALLSTGDAKRTEEWLNRHPERGRWAVPDRRPSEATPHAQGWIVRLFDQPWSRIRPET
jgi:hypothetical protein